MMSKLKNSTFGHYEEDQYLVECSGSLLTSSLVITAAHCFVAGYDLSVRAGVSNLRYRGALELRVGEVFVHPDYAPPQKYNDVALALLETSLPFSDKIGAICLPASPMEASDLQF